MRRGLALAFLLTLVGVPDARKMPAVPCPPGRYLPGGPPTVVKTPPVAAAPIVVGSDDGIARTAWIEGACGGAAKVHASKRGTTVRAVLAECPELPVAAKLSAIIDPTCLTLDAIIKARGIGKIAFRALLSRCGDGVVDPGAGEECEPTLDTGCDDTCRLATTSPADADLVLVLPSTSADQDRDMRERLRPWIERVQPLSTAFVSIRDVPHDQGVSAPGAEDVRQYLRDRFTHRQTTIDRPRYLGIVGIPHAQYGPVAPSPDLHILPRFTVRVRGSRTTDLDTDVPYGFLAPATLDGGDGFVDAGDLDMRAPQFIAFRIPILEPGDLNAFVTKANAFAAAPYRHDVALVSGEFGALPGDTSIVQCVNADLLAQGMGAGRVFKVLDHPSCQSDVLTTYSNRLADFLADRGDAFTGGLIHNISHGGFDAIYAVHGTNLASWDLARLAPEELNVFLSIACANDEHVFGMNLAMAMFQRNSVAVVSATENLYVRGGGGPIVDAEINALQALYASPRTLLQGLHRFRSGYYENYAIAGPLEDRAYHWVNLLAIAVLGDGLAVVAKAP